MIASRKFVMAGLLGVLGFAPMAQAQVNPFRGSVNPGLSAPDMAMLADAADRANRRPNPLPGHVEHFRNPATGTAGSVTLARLFHKSGMACHLLHYRFTTRHSPREASYNTTWCRTPDGAWKIAG